MPTDSDQRLTDPSQVDPDIEKRVKQYVAVRDHKAALVKKHKEELKPVDEALELLNGVLLNHLNQQKAQSIKTLEGTFYRNRRVSATIADVEAFKTYVIDGGHHNILDWRLNKTAAEAALERQEIIPGTNITVFYEAGVRRPDSKE
jgi:hypothetical protein